MVKDMSGLEKELRGRLRKLAGGCKKHFVPVSGGIDSAAVVALLCKEFGAENVVGLYRDIRSNPKHLVDVRALQKVIGFHLLNVDFNPVYDLALGILKDELVSCGFERIDEGTPEADKLGITGAYASSKSVATTWIADFVSKYIDGGRGRIYGTGNGEEDGLLRYFNKRGDGAVDSNILSGLTKAEVRQLARHLGVPENIITKKPSADLEANGDVHNDEDQLTKWAQDMGFDIKLSYGAPDGSSEGNIAWAWKEDIDKGVITGRRDNFSAAELRAFLGYSPEQVQLIIFLRQIEKSTRHKVEPIPGLERSELMRLGLVD